METLVPCLSDPAGRRSEPFGGAQRLGDSAFWFVRGLFIFHEFSFLFYTMQCDGYRFYLKNEMMKLYVYIF